jgi:hypothetical protein
MHRGRESFLEADTGMQAVMPRGARGQHESAIARTPLSPSDDPDASHILAPGSDTKRHISMPLPRQQWSTQAHHLSDAREKSHDVTHESAGAGATWPQSAVKSVRATPRSAKGICRVRSIITGTAAGPPAPAPAPAPASAAKTAPSPHSAPAPRGLHRRADRSSGQDARVHETGRRGGLGWLVGQTTLRRSLQKGPL